MTEEAEACTKGTLIVVCSMYVYDNIKLMDISIYYFFQRNNNYALQYAYSRYTFIHINLFITVYLFNLLPSRYIIYTSV